MDSNSERPGTESVELDPTQSGSAGASALAQAAEAVVNRDIPAAGGDGGAIALGADGAMAFPFNTTGMFRGWIGADGVPHVAVWPDEALANP